MRKRAIRHVLLLALLWGAAPRLWAQEILLDGMIRAGSLTCFPSREDPQVYYYLPDHPRLAVHEDGRPQFSFLKYVRNVEATGRGGLSDAEGGGIVHFLVEYGATEDEVREAERVLRREVPDARIKGPILYRSGHFTIVSSFKEKDGELAKRIVGIGRAPLIEGHKAAISMNLTRKGAQVLWESFRSATPDISVLFEMEFAGYREPYEATLTADWSMISKHKSFAAGGRFLWFGADIQTAFDELRRNGAIRLTTKGENKNLDALVAAAYSKLQDIIFEKVPSPKAAQVKMDDPYSGIWKAIRMIEAARSRRRAHRPAPRLAGVRLAGDPVFGDGGGLRLAAAPSASPAPRLRTPASKGRGRGVAPRKSRVRRGGGAAPPRKGSRPFGFSLIASYRMKKIKQSGTFTMNFNQYLEVKQPVVMAENLGDLYARYGDDPKVFRAVNVDDPVFRQREVLVTLDGQDADDFDRYVNFVTVQLKKVHENGEETLDEVVIRKENFNASGNSFVLLYGWKGDADREKWLRYRYRADWSFHGGVTWQGDWRESDQPMIALAPPYSYRRITLEADPEVFRERGVRHATVKLYYTLFGKEMTKQVTIKSRSKSFSVPLDYIHPRDDLGYAYEISWHLRGGTSVSSGRRRGDADILYCDEIP